MKRLVVVAGIVVAVAVVTSAMLLRSKRATQHVDGFSSWTLLEMEEKHPDKFEPYLEKYPADEPRRTAALVWYNRREKNVDRLKYHTVEMVRYHPDNLHIYFENTSVVYS